MTARSERLIERARRVIPGGVNSSQRLIPELGGLILVGTDGATFTDARGRVLVDFHGAFGPTLLGHNDPDVDGAVLAVGRSLDLTGIGATEVEIELAERIV